MDIWITDKTKQKIKGTNYSIFFVKTSVGLYIYIYIYINLYKATI